MYLLDTNVVSELRKASLGPSGSPVSGWVNSQQEDSLFLSAVSVLELEIGIQRMERRDARQGAILRSWLDQKLLPSFEGRILAFDLAIARRCANLHIPDPRPKLDAMIGATALVHGMTVVTRNVTDFEKMGVAILNPWD